MDLDTFENVSYELTPSFAESFYKDEGAGNHFTTAKLINIGEEIKGNIGYGDNTEDYFKVEVATEGTLRAVMKTYDGKGLGFTIYDEEYNFLIYQSAPSHGNLSVNVKPGTYYIGIEVRNNCDSYDLVASFEQSLNEDEGAGDHFNNAKVIAIDQKIKGTIGYGHGDNRNRVDYFKLEVPSDGILELELKRLIEERLGLEVLVYDENHKEILPRDPISRNNMTFEVKSGIHYIRLKAGSYDVGSYDLATFFTS